MALLMETLVDEWKPPREQVRYRDGWGLWFEQLSRNSLQYYPKKLVRDTILKRGTGHQGEPDRGVVRRRERELSKKFREKYFEICIFPNKQRELLQSPE